MKNPDNELAMKASSGNRDAFGKLYDKYFRKIFSFHYHRTYNKDTSEDLTGQTFLKAMEKISVYDEKKGSFSSWLYTIAYNCCIDYFRSLKNITVPIESIWELLETSDMDIVIEQKEYFEKIQACIQKLPKEKKTIIIMRFWDGLSYEEIGEILGITPDSCKMRLFRLLQLLRNVCFIDLLNCFFHYYK